MSSNLIDRTTDWGIAKLVKASDSESDMRRFESYYPCQGRTSERTSSDFFIMPLSIRNFMSFSRP